MTTPTGIDRDAPVIAHHEIDIAAPLDMVWNLHTDVDAWPAWNLEVTAAKLDGAFAPGNSFTWTSYDFTVTSTIYIVEDHSRTLWGGPAQGIIGTHEWRFAQSPAGVHVITTESFAGDPVDADPTGMQTILDNSLTVWLTRLKQKAESSAPRRLARERMTEAETAVRRFYKSLSTGDATLADEVLVPDAKTSRCPAISAHTHNERCVLPPIYLHLIYGPRISAGMIGEAPTRALLLWFRGGLGVVSGPGTRPDLRFGRRRSGCLSCGLSAGSQSWHPPAVPA